MLHRPGENESHSREVKSGYATCHALVYFISMISLPAQTKHTFENIVFHLPVSPFFYQLHALPGVSCIYGWLQNPIIGNQVTQPSLHCRLQNPIMEALGRPVENDRRALPSPPLRMRTITTVTGPKWSIGFQHVAKSRCSLVQVRYITIPPNPCHYSNVN